MQSPRQQFNIRPNCALTRRGWILAFSGLVLLCLGIAVRLTWMGYWVILSYALLNLAVVALVFRMLYRRSAIMEQVVIDQDEVAVFHVETAHNRDWRFPLHWVRVEIRPARHRWYPGRLLTGSHGKWIEIGAYLTDPERESLCSAITGTINQTRQNLILNTHSNV